MFHRTLTGVFLLLTAVSGHSQEQRSSREDYLDSKTVRWSDWVKSQPTSGEQGPSGKESKSQSKGQDTGFLTPDEINYLVSNEPFDTPKSKRPKKSVANKSLGEDKRIAPAKKADVLDTQPLQVPASPPAAPVITTQEPKEDTKFLFGAAAATFLLLQLIVVFLVFSLKSRLRKTIPNLTDIERKPSRETGPLQKEPDQDTLQEIQTRNDEALRAERDKNNTLLLEIHRLKADIEQKSDAPLQEMEYLKRQFVQERNALMAEIRDLQLRNDEFLRAAQEKNQDLLQEIQQLKATIASMTAEPGPELESVQDQYLVEKAFLQDKIRDPQRLDEKILREERENNVGLNVEIDRLNTAFAFITTAPSPSNSLIDDAVLENILSARTDGFMKR